MGRYRVLNPAVRPGGEPGALWKIACTVAETKVSEFPRCIGLAEASADGQLPQPGPVSDSAGESGKRSVPGPCVRRYQFPGS